MEDKAGCNKFEPSPSPCNGDGYGRWEGDGAMPGRNKANPRVEIDTSLPFGSVKEAVDHFEGSGFCLPFHCPVGIRHDQGEVDLKTVEERTLELEKNLIMKELETLDVLEELGTTKRIVEELKWQLQKEALKCMVAVPESDERVVRTPPREDSGGDGRNKIQSQDVILMELNQVKSNLGKTISELGMIQTSVESLSKRIKREKEVLEKTRLRLTLKPDSHATATYDQSKCTTGINAAEMKLVAARKMEEAARAAEAVAMAEIRALSRNETSLNIYLPERKNSVSFLQELSPTGTPRRNVEEAPTQNNKGGKSNASRSEILKKLEDATEEVKLSQQALEEALNRIEIANRKQVAACEALRGWMPKRGDRHRNLNPTNPIFSLDHQQAQSPTADLVVRTNISGNEPSPVFRTTVSMRDVLGRKQILPKEYVARRQTEGHRVALSQMLNELREDLTFPAKSCDRSQDQHRKKFGFIHISLPLMKQSKKNVRNSSVVQ